MTRHILIVCVLSSPLLAEQAPITIDARFDDWAGLTPLVIDPAGDGGSGIDLIQVWASDEPDQLFIRMDGAAEFDLSENNNLSIYIDTDQDSTTGLLHDGIGAELLFEFGERTGRFFTNTTTNPNSGVEIWQSDICLRGAPTVTGTEFEIALDRNALIKSDPVFQSDTVRFVIKDADGERVPDGSAQIEYQCDIGTPPPPRDAPFAREDADDLRLLTWNVWNDSPWNSGQASRFGRILQATNPDVLNFQEIYDHSPNQVRNFVADWLDPEPGGSWHTAGNNDCKTISRLPILHSEAIDGNLAVLIDTSDRIGTTLLVINTHFPCCNNDEGRQEEVDAILELIGRIRRGEHQSIPADTAIDITGDMNLVGLAQQLNSLIDGNIIDESQFGNDVQPDVDGSDLLDVASLQTESRFSYTWRNDNSSFWPGHLDFTILTDSVLDIGNSYVVDTRNMSSTRLLEYGLQENDSTCSDHLTVICDIREISKELTGDLDGDGDIDGGDLGLLLAAWNTDDANADLNQNGNVGGEDLGLMLIAWTG